MAKKSIFDGLGSILEFYSGTNEKNSSRPLTWQEFLTKTGDDIDRQLIAHARKDCLVYVGGKCQFTVTVSEQDEKQYILNVDVKLYYKDQFKAEKNFQIYPLHTERKFEDFALDDEETRTQLEQIRTEPYEMNVETPQIKEEKE